MRIVHDQSSTVRLFGWLPGFLLALPLAMIWVMRALLIAEPDGPIG